MRQVVKHLFFTFGFLYLILYNLPAVFDVLPFTGAVAELVQSGWDAVVPRVALSIFHVSADVAPNGSGDTTWNYVQLRAGTKHGMDIYSGIAMYKY